MDVKRQYYQGLKKLNKLTEILRSFYDFLPHKGYTMFDNGVIQCDIEFLSKWMFLDKWTNETKTMFFNFVKARFTILLEIERLRECLNY